MTRKTCLDFFNGMAPAEVVNAIPNVQAWEWKGFIVTEFLKPVNHAGDTTHSVARLAIT